MAEATNMTSLPAPSPLLFPANMADMADLLKKIQIREDFSDEDPEEDENDVLEDLGHYNSNVKTKRHDIVSSMISNLLPYTSFDAKALTVIAKIQDLEVKDLNFKDDIPESYLQAVFPKWQTAQVFVDVLKRDVPITHIEVNNTSGFNPDCRSHRGDDFTDDHLIPADTPKKPVVPSGYYFTGLYMDKAEIQKHNYVLSIDRKTYKPFWSKECPAGVTWWDILEGVMSTKGSKFDRWYELFCDAAVSFPAPDKVVIDLNFDHGS